MSKEHCSSTFSPPEISSTLSLRTASVSICGVALYETGGQIKRGEGPWNLHSSLKYYLLNYSTF